MAVNPQARDTIKAWGNPELERLQAELEKALPEKQTDTIRGQIKAVRSLLAFAQDTGIPEIPPLESYELGGLDG